MGREQSHVLTMPRMSKGVIDDLPHRNLIRAASDGDRQAFDALRRQYDVELRSFVSRRARPDETDDLLQDIWLSAWTSMKNYSGRCRFKTWLYSIALFKIRDLYRRNVRDQIWITHEDTDLLTSSDDPVATEVQKQWVKAALDSLTPDQRQLLELYYFAEFTLAEIAVILNKPPNPVKYQFYRAHREVADYMNKTSQTRKRHEG